MVSCPKRILIVEDNKLDVKLLKDILETRGYRPATGWRRYI